MSQRRHGIDPCGSAGPILSRQQRQKRHEQHQPSRKYKQRVMELRLRMLLRQSPRIPSALPSRWACTGAAEVPKDFTSSRTWKAISALMGSAAYGTGCRPYAREGRTSEPRSASSARRACSVLCQQLDNRKGKSILGWNFRAAILLRARFRHPACPGNSAASVYAARPVPVAAESAPCRSRRDSHNFARG